MTCRCASWSKSSNGSSDMMVKSCGTPPSLTERRAKCWTARDILRWDGSRRWIWRRGFALLTMIFSGDLLLNEPLSSRREEAPYISMTSNQEKLEPPHDGCCGSERESDATAAWLTAPRFSGVRGFLG